MRDSGDRHVILTPAAPGYSWDYSVSTGMPAAHRPAAVGTDEDLLAHVDDVAARSPEAGSPPRPRRMSQSNERAGR